MNTARLTVRAKTAKLAKLFVESELLRKALHNARTRAAESAENHRLTFKAMADRIRALESENSKLKSKP